jgi:hypothetical protein
MKKILFFLCITSMWIASCKAQKEVTTGKKNKQQHQKNNTSKKQDKPKENPEREGIPVVKDTPRIVIDSILYGKQQIELNQKLNEAILKKLEEKEKDKTVEWLIPLIVSAIFGISAFYFSQNTMRRDKRYRDLAFTAEVDKLLIEHPELRAYDNDYTVQKRQPLIISAPVTITITGKEKIKITGTHSFEISPLNGDIVKISSDGTTNSFVAADAATYKDIATDKEYEIENNTKIKITQCSNVIILSTQDEITKSKIRAFCYYILNNFELALMHHDENSIVPWENYLKHTYDKSSQFQELVKKAQGENKHIFSVDFVKKLNDLFPGNKTI